MTALAITIAVLFSGQDAPSTTIRELLSKQLDDPQRIFAQLGSLSIPLESPTSQSRVLPENAASGSFLVFKTSELDLGIDLATQKIIFFEGPYPANESWGRITKVPETINQNPAQEAAPEATSEAPPDPTVPLSPETETILERLRQRRIAESETKWNPCDRFQHLISKTQGQQRIQSIIQRFGSDTPVPIDQIHLVIQVSAPHWFFLSPLGASLDDITKFTVCAIPASDSETQKGGYEIAYARFDINAEPPSDNPITAADARKRILEGFQSSQQGEELDAQVRQGYWLLKRESRDLGMPLFEPGWVFTVRLPYECDDLPANSLTKLYIVGKNSGEVHDFTL